MDLQLLIETHKELIRFITLQAPSLSDLKNLLLSHPCFGNSLQKGSKGVPSDKRLLQNRLLTKVTSDKKEKHYLPGTNMKHGYHIVWNKKGKIKQVDSYHKGRLHGECYSRQSGSSFEELFVKGTLIYGLLCDKNLIYL